MFSGLLLIIFGLVVVVGAGAFFMLSASSQAAIASTNPGNMPKGLPGGKIDVLQASVFDLRRGAVLVAKGFGDEFEDANLTIDAYNKFSGEGVDWHELVSEYAGRLAGLEWHEGGGARKLFALSQQRSLELSQVGLDGAGLDAIAEGASACFGGKTFHFAKKGEALFHTGGDGFGKKLEYWIFKDGEAFLRVERRLEQQPQVSIGRPFSEDSFDIYRIRG